MGVDFKKRTFALSLFILSLLACGCGKGSKQEADASELAYAGNEMTADDLPGTPELCKTAENGLYVFCSGEDGSGSICFLQTGQTEVAVVAENLPETVYAFAVTENKEILYLAEDSDAATDDVQYVLVKLDADGAERQRCDSTKGFPATDALLHRVSVDADGNVVIGTSAALYIFPQIYSR